MAPLDLESSQPKRFHGVDDTMTPVYQIIMSTTTKPNNTQQPKQRTARTQKLLNS